MVSDIRGVKGAVGRFLAANAFAEFGLYDESLRELRELRSSREVHAPVMVALSRVLAAAGETSELLKIGGTIPWSDLPAEDRGEVACRLARASFAEERYASARAWLARVPADSSWVPFASFLHAQADFADGRYAKAIATAGELLRLPTRSSTARQLRDRTAILLGDIFTELGRYERAVESLRLPAPESPFAARAKRDLLVATGLRDLELGKFADAAPIIAEVHGYLRDLAREVAGSVHSEEEVARRAEELLAAWPARFLVYARREWAASWARHTLAAAAPRSRGLLGTLPSRTHARPVNWLRRGRAKPDPWLPPRPPASRFFFPPHPRIATLLRGLALLGEPPASSGESCSVLAATAIRRRAAAWMLGEAKPPSRKELLTLARGCTAEPAQDDLLHKGTEQLFRAIRQRASEIEKEFQHDELEIENAIGRAYLAQFEVHADQEP